MTLREFINTMTYGILMGMRENVTRDSMSKTYDETFFFLPRIWCKDGFNISVQVHHGNYCASENGTREFGLNWLEVEWGFPSEEIDGEKYNAEDESYTMNSVGGYINVDLLDSLLTEHGGIDLQTTLEKHLKG